MFWPHNLFPNPGNCTNSALPTGQFPPITLTEIKVSMSLQQTKKTVQTDKKYVKLRFPQSLFYYSLYYISLQYENWGYYILGMQRVHHVFAKSLKLMLPHSHQMIDLFPKKLIQSMDSHSLLPFLLFSWSSTISICIRRKPASQPPVLLLYCVIQRTHLRNLSSFFPTLLPFSSRILIPILLSNLLNSSSSSYANSPQDFPSGSSNLLEVSISTFNIIFPACLLVCLQ